MDTAKSIDCTLNLLSDILAPSVYLYCIIKHDKLKNVVNFELRSSEVMPTAL